MRRGRGAVDSLVRLVKRCSRVLSIDEASFSRATAFRVSTVVTEGDALLLLAGLCGAE